MENERLARLEEKCERIPIIEQKLDRLSERFNIGFGKILGACSISALLAVMAVHWFHP